MPTSRTGISTMNVERSFERASSGQDPYRTPEKLAHPSSKRRPDSASTSSGEGSARKKGKYTFQRDRRHRDAPGGTRNIQKIYRWQKGERVSKFRALLPLANNMEPYILGDFSEMQDALQTADRAVLAYYGRGHPLGATNSPHELYEVEQLSGPDLAGYLLSLEPAGWDRSRAIIDRGPKSRAAGISRATESMQQGSGSQGSSGGGDDTESQDEEEAEEGEGLAREAVPQKGAPQPVSLKAAAQHRRQRLRELQAAQELAATLGSNSEAPQSDANNARPAGMFEADAPREAGPDTRVDRTGFSWADPRSSRFAKPYDYAADLRHIARCRAAGTAVEVKVREDISCSRCGMAGHNARNMACPLRAYTGEPSKHHISSRAGPLPAWHEKLSPQMEGVLRAVCQAAGNCLDTPEMSLFQPLRESLSSDALLAIGCMLEASLLAEGRPT